MKKDKENNSENNTESITLEVDKIEYMNEDNKEGDSI